MPALSDTNFINPSLVGRDAAANSSVQLQPVVCAWSVSGEYGTGSRILYYVLVAACVLARKSEWLRNACLAAALVIPATAAIHGIVLAALHSKDAVDFDIYGCFQFCAIAILTAPATVRLSKTYFNNPGRNVLFVWTVLLLAGLLALTVEFFRTQTAQCIDDGRGQPLPLGAPFPYGVATCGLNCSSNGLPSSPMRTGAADNINVVPAPHVLTFGAATLIAAACCIPGILSMVSMWDKILRTNWARQFGESDTGELISGTNGATVGGMKTINEMIRDLLSRVEIPVFGGAVIGLLVVGEYNFYSAPLHWDIDPLGNVSQWSSIAASIFAACGSLYMLFAEWLNVKEKGATTPPPTGPCSCQCHEHGSTRSESLSDDADPGMQQIRHQDTAATDAGLVRRITSPATAVLPSRADTYPRAEDLGHGLGIHHVDSAPSVAGSRREPPKTLMMKIATAISTASPERFDDSGFRHSRATDFPEIPGEIHRNRNLIQNRELWGQQHAHSEDALTPRGPRTRANSFHGGSTSRASSIGPPARSPTSPLASQPPEVNLGLPVTASPESTVEPVFPRRPSAELEPTRSPGTVVTLHEGPNSPAIVLSSDDEPAEAGPSGSATPPMSSPFSTERAPPTEKTPPTEKAASTEQAPANKKAPP